MAQTSVGKPAARGRAGSAVGSPVKAATAVAKADKVAVGTATKVEAVMQAAAQSGLLSERSGRIAGRVSPALVRQAKRLTGIETDTDLIAFALATVALEDSFAEMFAEARGKVDPELKLGF